MPKGNSQVIGGTKLTLIHTAEMPYFTYHFRFQLSKVTLAGATFESLNLIPKPEDTTEAVFPTSFF